MAKVFYEHQVMIDTSAVIALLDHGDRFHGEAERFFGSENSLVWFAVNTTSHETFTRIRYNNKGLNSALEHYDFLRSNGINTLEFIQEDESLARELLVKYKDQRLSFHDVLCAAVMLRVGIFRVFTFDKEFWMFGFEIVPGITY